ncbi:cobalt-precorrin-5B (C(1))-methyltransferase CbiD [Lachnobacterium bovis]|uniref:cobalt-precorrin-5B (C(1))-methyltransferase CbiD n=1 Tax=Lachnobacterium bovis TaxID=140626 RepID=UPI0003B750C9|nr:cobalt-precorrin-5B (C(1))-methyltransferase CbiD [Lachnobacterium bovis]
MRYGFTTGSCAAAASKAAIYMLLSGKKKETITIITPKQIEYSPKIEKITMEENFVMCAVQKDGGDDVDATDKAYIFSKVSIEKNSTHELEIIIDGGKGVGRITKPGLDQPVGNAAINSVPRKMIKEEVEEVCKFFDFSDTVKVEISVPNGIEIAKKTFNPRLGIVGGISILGTSGIVEPMSKKALVDTIRVEINQKKALGYDILAISPGNYGLNFMKETYDYDLEKSVKCSNFIGETLDIAKELGFKKVLLSGHIGKLVKVAGGIMNTHSKEADCRMEILAAATIRATDDVFLARKVLDTISTEDALSIIIEADKNQKIKDNNKVADDEKYNIKEGSLLKRIMDIIIEKIYFYLNNRHNGEIEVEVIVFSSNYGELGKSKLADDYIKDLKKYEH